MPNNRIGQFYPSTPTTVAECIDDEMTYTPTVLNAMKRFRSEKPWRGTSQERMDKFVSIHNQLCSIYGIEVELRFVNVERDSFSGESCYIREENRIELRDRLSVISYLHVFARAIGKSRIGAFRWSLNLFKRIFPLSWSRLRFQGLFAFLDR